MRRVEGRVRVAIAQSAPVFLDLNGSVEKAVRLIAEAARQGAHLVAFGESWLPGYPAWLDLCPGSATWDHAPAKRAYARLAQNSPVIPGPETDRLCDAARENGLVIVIGAHEKVEAGPGHGTLYNTNLLIGSDGSILSRHRKLVPTHAERLVWGQGDGSGLEAVTTSAGRVGSLICWEHWMPLARQAMHESAEEIHVANWPTVRDMYLVASRHYAFEGRCFVLAAGSITAARDLPRDLELPGARYRHRARAVSDRADRDREARQRHRTLNRPVLIAAPTCPWKPCGARISWRMGESVGANNRSADDHRVLIHFPQPRARSSAG